ncbi:unnamed protein product [Schistosoma margrebowiei]|uniref:THO complex subunit 2 N-terminal domain-containing protein n=1 Tax=Schistosoma margrebowiei TaxID=48269 RepID=A0A3P7YWA9_9TREM|nr:unnamed protein product [Schistosoma margrebowiei]
MNHKNFPNCFRACPLPACLQRNRFRPKIESFKALNASINVHVIDEKSSVDCEIHEDKRTIRNNNNNNNNNNNCILLSPVHDFAGLAKYVIPIAIYLGPHMSYDLILMVKFCRLGQIYLSEQQQNLRSDKIGIVYQGFFNLLDEVLLPSLSLVDANCCLAEEIWQMLRFLPYEHRRLSKENVKPMGRHLGKLSHSNPGLLFDHLFLNWLAD